MRMMILFLIFSCLSCSVSKNYDKYIGQTRDYLISFEGTPSDIKRDTAVGEQIAYRKNFRLHNPKYLSVTDIVTFYVKVKVRFTNGLKGNTNKHVQQPNRTWLLNKVCTSRTRQFVMRYFLIVQPLRAALCKWATRQS